MKKYLYNFYLIIININNYGLITIFKAAIVELYYLLKIRDYKSYIHDEKFTSSYRNTKKNKEYNTQHTPTPYYFLTFAEEFLKKNNINDFILVDLGCGYGRVGKFFIKKFNCLFYGLEINKKLIEDLTLENNKNSKFFLYNVDLKNKIMREAIFEKIVLHNKMIVLFISDPFDVKTIIEISEYFKKRNHYILGINIKDIQMLLKKYNKIESKEFKINTRHIMLLEPRT